MSFPWGILIWIWNIWFWAVQSVRLLGVSLHIVRVRRCSTKSRAENGNHKEGVTILRPMRGIHDADLYGCLKSSFVQTYSPIQILMCVSEPDDPAIEVAERLLQEFPNVDAEILIGPDAEYGINPKVNNLVKGYKKAKYNMIWALDSNVAIHPDALARSIPLFSGNIQLVHHLPLARTPPKASAGGLLDVVYMMTAHSTFYTGINAVGIAPCVTGKSNIYRRSDLDAAVNAEHEGGGLQEFSRYMAEDQMISEALWAQGGRIAIAPDAAIQPLGPSITVLDYWLRRSRWIRLRKYMVTSATLVEPFTDCFFNIYVSSLIEGPSLLSSLKLLVGWLLIDWLNYRILLGYMDHSLRPQFEWGWLPVWALREALAFPLWVWAMSGRRIWWRNRTYKINRDLSAEALD